MKPRGFACRLRVPELLLAAASVAACTAVLVVAEFLSRRLDPHYLDRVRGAEVYSERYGWKLRPGFAGLLHDVPTTVNARGYRGALHPYERTPGKTRLLMLGDSVAFGFKVRDFETFSFLLEHRGDRYEVVNLGVEGYGTDQELLVLEEEGLRYHPDVVVLNVCVANDPLDNLLSWSWRPKPHFTWDGRRLVLHDEGVRLSPSRRAIQWLADESHVLNRLRELFFTSDPSLSPPAPRPWQRFDRHAANELTVRIACQVRDVAQRAAADVLVLLHPDRVTFEHRSPLAAHLASGLRSHGIRVLELVEIYWAARLRYEQVAIDGQGHLTPLAHHLVAEEIETLLEAPPPPASVPASRSTSPALRNASTRKPAAASDSAR
jgi:GDSL-like lipase/acylhydrolase family protein